MVHAITITTPDGVGRTMRLTHGAQRRIDQHIGQPEIGPTREMVGLYHLAYISRNLVELAYYMMYDQDGAPPEGLSLDAMREQYAPDDKELFGAVCEALSKGKKKAAEASAALGKMEMELERATTGSMHGPSPESVSASPEPRRPRRASRVSSGTSTPMSSTL